MKNGLNSTALERSRSTPFLGGSGVPGDMRQFLARTTTVSKFNIGTELRMVFGSALRQSLAVAPNQFDRIALLKAVESPITNAARAILREIGPAEPLR